MHGPDERRRHRDRCQVSLKCPDHARKKVQRKDRRSTATIAAAAIVGSARCLLRPRSRSRACNESATVIRGVVIVVFVAVVVVPSVVVVALVVAVAVIATPVRERCGQHGPRLIYLFGGREGSETQK